MTSPLDIIRVARDAELEGRADIAAKLYAEAAPDFAYVRKSKCGWTPPGEWREPPRPLELRSFDDILKEMNCAMKWLQAMPKIEYPPIMVIDVAW